MANTIAQPASSTRAIQEVAGQADDRQQDHVENVPRIRASVRRLKKRRTRGTISPPTICAPATIAAARPAIP